MAIRIRPPHIRTLLPALTYLRFQGVPEYMEDLLCQIDAPLLESLSVSLFPQEGLETSELAKFVCRPNKLSSAARAEVISAPDSITVTLSQESQRVDLKTLVLNLTHCEERDSLLLYLAQFCTSCLPTLSTFECLDILLVDHMLYDDEDNPDPGWLELLLLFDNVKNLYLSQYIAPHVVQVLRRLPAERVTEVLPALEKVIICGLKHFRPLREASFQFADARQLSGHPVSIFDPCKGEWFPKKEMD